LKAVPEEAEAEPQEQEQEQEQMARASGRDEDLSNPKKNMTSYQAWIEEWGITKVDCLVGQMVEHLARRAVQ
jgi:hypothetical protein